MSQRERNMLQTTPLCPSPNLFLILFSQIANEKSGHNTYLLPIFCLPSLPQTHVMRTVHLLNVSGAFVPTPLCYTLAEGLPDDFPANMVPSQPDLETPNVIPCWNWPGISIGSTETNPNSLVWHIHNPPCSRLFLTPWLSSGEVLPQPPHTLEAVEDSLPSSNTPSSVGAPGPWHMSLSKPTASSLPCPPNKYSFLQRPQGHVSMPPFVNVCRMWHRGLLGQKWPHGAAP